MKTAGLFGSHCANITDWIQWNISLEQKSFIPGVIPPLLLQPRMTSSPEILFLGVLCAPGEAFQKDIYECCQRIIKKVMLHGWDSSARGITLAESKTKSRI